MEGESLKKLGTIIITGGNGFVGSYLVLELQAHAQKIVVWDRLLKNMPDGVEGLQIDITKSETYRDALASLQPQWIVHLAAIASVPYAAAHPEETWKVNVEGTRLLFETVQQVSPQTKILAVSSADIYGVSSFLPIAELPLLNCHPQNPYARSKFEMEQVVEQAFLNQVIRVRPFPHIGPGQPQGFVTADFASQIAAIERKEQPPIIKVGNLLSQRDFTDVRDVVCAYRLLMESGKIDEVYNVASGSAVAIQQVLDMLLKQAKVQISVEQDGTRLRSNDTSVIVGDVTKLKSVTGWQPTISLEKSLAEILEYWRGQSKD